MSEQVIRARITSVINVSEFYPSPLGSLCDAAGNRLPIPQEQLIADTERLLGVPFPPWLREVYLACNGFAGPTEECYLYPLDGYEGTGEFTVFCREEDWAPPWVQRAIVFGYISGSGSITRHSVALDGQLGEWCYSDGEFRPSDDLFATWQRVQQVWDELV